MSAYYNEIEPYAAQWLRNLIKAGLIADGEVDERSIVDVQADDLRGFTQCHFFAGIGGWSYALRLAGWPDDRPVWTGSCPCQPFSSASNSRNARREDDRHLWPIWQSLIAECAPCVVFGEQTSQAGDWFDGACDDMADLDYSVGAAILPATAIGQDHARARIYFVCDSNSDRQSSQPHDGQARRVPGDRSINGGVAQPDGLPNRMAVMRAYGNAIVPQVAAEFIGAFMECAA